MAQFLNNKFAGLHTFASDLTSVPEGALVQADNIVIDRDNEAEPRRGFDYMAHGGVKSSFSDPSYRANKIFFYQNKTLVHYATNLMAYHDDATGWVALSGTYDPPTGAKVRSVQANKNLYFTTATGPKKLDVFNGTPSNIGVSKGLDLVSTVAVAPASTFLIAGGTVSYRLLWGIKDANLNVVKGGVSQTTEITNTTNATCAIKVVATIPAGITTAHFYQLYRSTTFGSVTDGYIQPNDELGLVYEGNPVAGDFINGFVSITDITPDELRGATIYTAASQEYLTANNEPIPYCTDMATFKGSTFYANTVGVQSYNLTMLATGSPSGIQIGDTLTIGGVVFTAAASENTATGTFQITPTFTLTTTGTVALGSTSLTSVGSTTGVTVGNRVIGTDIPLGTYVTAIVGATVTMSAAATGAHAAESVTFTGDSVAQSIKDTAQSLVRVINRYASSTVYAYYMSGVHDAPGQILLEARVAGASAFAVISSRATWSNPALPTSGTAQSSTSDVQKNGIYYSKTQQPEHVPLGYNQRVGSADKAILRIIAQRDSLFIFKEDGVFRLYGTGPSSFEISPLDLTAILIAPDSAVSLNNVIYFLSTQGVCYVSESGVKIMSHPIEFDLLSLIPANYSALQTSTFGVAYESSRAYYLHCITNGADTSPTQYWRYNYITNTWTRGTLAKNCGGVNPFDDKLYTGNSSAAIVDVERKSLSYLDYADYASTQTITAVSGTSVTLTGSDTLSVGSIIYQSNMVFGTVVSVDSIAGVVTTSLPVSFTLASADILSPINVALTWAPVTFGNPGSSKQLREVDLTFRTDFNGTATVGFSSDKTPGFEYESITGGNVGGWGLFAWGGPAETPLGAAWGGSPGRRNVRVSVPRNHQRCNLLTVSFTHSYGFSPWILQGIATTGNVISERN